MSMDRWHRYAILYYTVLLIATRQAWIIILRYSVPSGKSLEERETDYKAMFTSESVFPFLCFAKVTEKIIIGNAGSITYDTNHDRQTSLTIMLGLCYSVLMDPPMQV